MPFTYEQAAEICEDFEDLEGTELTIRTEPPVRCDIDHICMAPYDETGRSRFLEAYAAVNDPAVALSGYSGSEFEVLILGHNVKNNNEMVVLTIEDYVAANGVNYNFPE